MTMKVSDCSIFKCFLKSFLRGNSVKLYLIKNLMLSSEFHFEQDAPIIQNLAVSLIEILNGYTKQFNFEREMVHSDGILQREKVTLNVKIMPGTKSGMEEKFIKFGHRSPNKIQSNINFIVSDETHPIIKRSKNQKDIEYAVKIDQRQSTLLDISYYELKIPTLEND